MRVASQLKSDQEKQVARCVEATQKHPTGMAELTFIWTAVRTCTYNIKRGAWLMNVYRRLTTSSRRSMGWQKFPLDSILKDIWMRYVFDYHHPFKPELSGWLYLLLQVTFRENLFYVSNCLRRLRIFYEVLVSQIQKHFNKPIPEPARVRDAEKQRMINDFVRSLIGDLEYDSSPFTSILRAELVVSFGG